MNTVAAVSRLAAKGLRGGFVNAFFAQLVPVLHVMGCTRDRNVERGTKGFRVRKTGLSSTLIKLRYEQ